MAAGWCLDTSATTKEINALICKDNTHQHWAGLGHPAHAAPSQASLQPFQTPAVTQQESRFSLRAHLQCPSSTAPAGLLLTRCGELTLQNQRLPMARQQLHSKLQPPQAYTSASEIPPDCNLAQVLWVGETLISTKFGINLCRCFCSAGMEKMNKRITIFCKQYLHS